MALSTEGIPIKQIVRQTGLSRGTVGQILRGCRSDVFRQRESSLEAYWPLLEALWTDGCRNGAELWRRLRAAGFRGSLRVVGEWITRRRRAERIGDEQLQRVPSARTIARLMSTGRDTLSKAETVSIAAIESGVPALVSARDTVAEFQTLIRSGREADLTSWISRARESLVASFATGIAKDEAAVRAAITLPWSNGQTEGQITRLKLVKRQMYGRGHLDLLQARLVGAE
jgi:transposase